MRKTNCIRFNKELKRIIQKYGNDVFLLRFINERICNFERGKEEMIIPEWLLDERKKNSVRFPYSPEKEKSNNHMEYTKSTALI